MQAKSPHLLLQREGFGRDGLPVGGFEHGLQHARQLRRVGPQQRNHQHVGRRVGALHIQHVDQLTDLGKRPLTRRHDNASRASVGGHRNRVARIRLHVLLQHVRQRRQHFVGVRIFQHEGFELCPRRHARLVKLRQKRHDIFHAFGQGSDQNRVAVR